LPQTVRELRAVCPDVEDDVGAIVADSGAVLVTALGDRQLAGSRGPSIDP
jgi:hypothetical protein